MRGRLIGAPDSSPALGPPRSRVAPGPARSSVPAVLLEGDAPAGWSPPVPEPGWSPASPGPRWSAALRWSPANTGPRSVALPSLGHVVQAPVVVEVAQLRAAQELRLLARREADQVLLHRLRLALEVLGEPLEDLGDGQLLRGRVDAVARAVVDEGAHLLVKLGLELLGGEGLVAQRGAAHRGAVDGRVQARVLELTAQDLVLDVVQRQVLVLAVRAVRPHRDEALVEDRVEPERPVELADALQRVMIDHPLDAEGVVGVDPEGEALRLAPAAELGRRHRDQAGEVGVEAGAVLLQLGVVEAAVANAGAQDLAPGRMRVVERAGRGLREGARPQRGRAGEEQREGEGDGPSERTH